MMACTSTFFRRSRAGIHVQERIQLIATFRLSTCCSCANDVSLGVPVGENQPSPIMIMCGIEVRKRHGYAAQCRAPTFIIIHVQHHPNSYRDNLRRCHSTQVYKVNKKTPKGVARSFLLHI